VEFSIMKATGIILCDWTLCIAVYWSFVPVSPANTHECSLSFTQWHLHILITDEKLVLMDIMMSPWKVLLTLCHLLYAQARKIVHHVRMIDKLCPSKRQNKQLWMGFCIKVVNPAFRAVSESVAWRNYRECIIN